MRISVLPKSHVPVVVCRLAGIRTRGRSTAGIKPAAGGEPANPAIGGSRLKATTDRAFSSLLALQRPTYRRGLSILPGVRKGTSPSKRRLQFEFDACKGMRGWFCVQRRSTRPGRIAAVRRLRTVLDDDSFERCRVSIARGGSESLREAVVSAWLDPRPSWGCRDDRSYSRIPPCPTPCRS